MNSDFIDNLPIIAQIMLNPPETVNRLAIDVKKKGTHLSQNSVIVID